ncbi:hypothetical protein [Aquipuribacter hungaricus]|uniref:hypothetical protein n=1 Tax=Aquipuribacter hungaricus TaxID=545624 RepID=UPI0030EE2303
MSVVPTGSSTRDGIALVMAAMRTDPAAVAVLLEQMTPKQTQEVAVFCAFLAADQLKAAEASLARPGHYADALQAVALQLAASGRTML